MLLIEKYELLKHEGSTIDRVKFILSLSDRTQVEIYLKKSAVRSYDDLQMLVFLSKSTKNQTNLIEILKTDAFPVHQRADAAKAWLQLRKDKKQIFNFQSKQLSIQIFLECKINNDTLRDYYRENKNLLELPLKTEPKAINLNFLGFH